jgi:hypothetical protein
MWYFMLAEPHVTLEMPRCTFALPRGKRETSYFKRAERQGKLSLPQVKFAVTHGTLPQPRRKRDAAHCQRAMSHGKLHLHCGKCAAR